MTTYPQTTPAPEPAPVPPAPSVPPARALNRRQEMFCAHYALNGNAAEGARAAGYSESSAKNHGYRLLNDPRINDLIYRIRVARAIRFGPVMAFARLEYLFQKASKAGDFRGVVHILTLQARLAGVESWMPPSAVVREKQREQLGLGRAGEPSFARRSGLREGGSPRAFNDAPLSGRGALGPKAPFDNLDEQCDIAYAPPDDEATENDDR
ncbi:MAG: terminase small subunit [Rhodospirillales bacterium]|nr:terminase small subunit [Rhodospirillales bacterium]